MDKRIWIKEEVCGKINDLSRNASTFSAIFSKIIHRFFFSLRKNWIWLENLIENVPFVSIHTIFILLSFSSRLLSTIPSRKA